MLAIRAGHLFDGERGHGAGMVLVENGLITAVDTSGAPAPEGVLVHDFGDHVCLMPGLIDCHVHLALDASPHAAVTIASEDDDVLLERMRSAATTALNAGITTLRDLGDRGFLALRLRELLGQSELPAPEIIAAGPPLTTRGGRFSVLGGEAEGGEELMAAVSERASRGCEVVKVMASGGSTTPGSRPYEAQYALEDLHLIVEQAHAYGLRTAAHVHAVTSIVDALDAGFDTLEHVTFFTAEGVDADQRLIERLAESGTFVSLTVGSVPGLASPPPAVAERLEQMLVNASRICSAGARVVLGTDAGINPGKPHDVLPYALEALVGLDVSCVQALHAVTAVAADACGLRGRKGRLAVGADADLIAVRGDPLTDISAIRNIVAVYRSGVLALDRRLYD
jgi:imidazolonepropionase-like amidohydrolase